MMNKEEKSKIITKVLEALDKVTHGTITIELRGLERPIDVVVSDRTRFEINTKKK